MRSIATLLGALVCSIVIGQVVRADNTIFVTSTAGSGNLSTWADAGGQAGLAAADNVCSARAAAAGLAGTYKAWLSSSTASASSRLIHSTSPYRMVDGTIVADNWADLTDGTLDASINRTESNAIVGAVGIWTGTNTDGTYGGASCFDWASTITQGVVGQTSTTTSTWTNAGNGACSFGSNRIYCVQQVAAPTASLVSVSGRVTSPAGQGIRGALVIMTDSRGTRFSSLTNAFGMYTVKGIRAGETYMAAVSSRTALVFVPRAITVNDTLQDVNFAGQ